MYTVSAELSNIRSSETKGNIGFGIKVRIEIYTIPALPVNPGKCGSKRIKNGVLLNYFHL